MELEKSISGNDAKGARSPKISKVQGNYQPSAPHAAIAMTSFDPISKPMANASTNYGNFLDT